MEETTLNSLADLFLALSDRTRLKLMRLMAAGEVSVGYLAEQLGDSQPKISRHLAYLRQMDLVSTRRDGKWIYYAVAMPADETAAEVLRYTFGISPVELSSDILNEPENIYAETYTTPPEREELEIFLL